MSEKLADAVMSFLHSEMTKFGSDVVYAVEALPYQELVTALESQGILQIDARELRELLYFARIGSVESGRPGVFNELYTKVKERNPQFNTVYQSPMM